MMQNTLKNDWNPGIWVLIRVYLARDMMNTNMAQGLDGFQKFLHLCALDESSLSIGRVNQETNIVTYHYDQYQYN